MKPKNFNGLVTLAESSETISKARNLNAPQDPTSSSNQVKAKKRHGRQDSGESRSSPSHPKKHIKYADFERPSRDGLAENPCNTGQLGIRPADACVAFPRSHASLKGKNKATKPPAVVSPSQNKNPPPDTAQQSSSPSVSNTKAQNLTRRTLHKTTNAKHTPLAISLHRDHVVEDSFHQSLDDDSEATDLQSLHPFPNGLSSRTTLNDISLNIPSMRFQSMPPPRAMGLPLHQRLLRPQLSDVIPSHIKNSVQKAFRECLQENNVALQALLQPAQPQPVIVNALPLPAVVRHRGDSHHFGNLSIEQVVEMIKCQHLGRAARYSSAPHIFTYRGTIREPFQWLGAEGHFTEVEWKRVGGKMGKFRTSEE